MAPNICVTEFPMAELNNGSNGTTVHTYVRRRQRSQNVASVRRRTLALEQMLLRSGPIAETSLASRENCSRGLKYTNAVRNQSISDKRLQADEPYKKVTIRRDLLNIVARTMTLVQRNYILQKRVNALHAETRRYLCSTLSNPKNRCQEQRLQEPHSEGENVPPFTKQVVSPSPSLSSDSSDENSHHGLAYTHNHNDKYSRVDDDCSPDDNSEGSSRNGY
ncbi:hypothetical protein DMN91_001961 [Ooceraea biroi]|uniref:Uncharacterized protein n=1 Tax=Ooceraea biroi TaxID=2015173 RepID=A0A026WCE3_OOCBI|nr:uncharacterized protein LOC105281687 [Ooceraea biroi]XP_011341407.1 uncharacterized protein LOC105281687 [Ooceraea biroi]EZA52714.1 hypothetical protein X777_07095 [Ooceraea biroi]RLU25801.1 hypothetical protein DMN91_001961 [Ooceraea biroi]